MSSLIWIVLSIVLSIGYIVYQRFFHPLASIPGPFFASVSRLWLVQRVRNADMVWAVMDLHQKHGPLVRTGPNEVSVSDLAAVKQIYGAGTRFSKSSWYSVWQGRRKFDLFPERNEKLHAEQKRLVSRIYSVSALRDLEPYVNNCIGIFLSQMQAQETGIIDIGYWLQLFAFDVIGEITFSKRFGFMDTGDDGGAFAKILAATQSASWVGQIPAVYWINDFFSPYIGNRLAIAHRHGSIRQFAVQEITSRLDRGSDHQDILSKLNAIHKEKPQEFTREDMISMATSNIFAGSDTTAISTRAILYYLLKNPECKNRLCQELNELERQGKLSDPVELEEADKMPYLQAIMYEALRLHPVTGLTLGRMVPPEGVTIAGKFIPGGMTIGTSPWLVHRNKEVYGDDVDSFRPERWLEENNGDMHRFFFAFGGGARLCIGKNISWMEMSKLVPTLFRRYDINLAEPDRQWTMKCWWFVYQDGVKIRLTPRTTGRHLIRLPTTESNNGCC